LFRYGGEHRLLPIPGTEPTLSNHDTRRYMKGRRAWSEYFKVTAGQRAHFEFRNCHTVGHIRYL